MIEVKIISNSNHLPEMKCSNFFHSAELFRIIEKTPGQWPYMAIAYDEKGHIVGHLLAIMRRRGSLFPPYFFTHGHIYGEGEYDENADKTEVFGYLLAAITKKFKRNLCLFAEFSDISKKMFGYRHFRHNSYFPISWQEIHNSLHSMPPENRLTDKQLKRIDNIYQMGVETREISNEEELKGFYKLLKAHYRIKMRRLIPPIELFVEFNKCNRGKIFVTLYHGKIIGGCVCVFSEGNAYLWYLASRRKTYSKLHPNFITVWNALSYSYHHNYAHFYFLDAGLPWRANPYREFILSFGGKPVAKYRWFRISFSWVNKLLSWLYRE
ncbi:MAG: GNAT family N-acetyltransferase [Prevotella sp.]|jgi:hypothetical protein